MIRTEYLVNFEFDLGCGLWGRSWDLLVTGGDLAKLSHRNAKQKVQECQHWDKNATKQGD